MKKILCVLMTVVLIAASALTVSASVISNRDTVRLVKADLEFDAETINDIIHGSLLNSSVSYTVADGITVYNSDTDNVFNILPVMNGVFCVATIHADDGSYILSSDTSIYYAARELDAGDYIIYIANGICYAESEEKTVYLSDTGMVDIDTGDYADLSFRDKVTNIEKALADEEYSMAALAEINDAVCTVQSKSSTDSTVSVTATSSDTVSKVCDIKYFIPQGEHNLCWAANCATILDYKRTYLSLDAFDVADFCGVGYEDGGTADNCISVLRFYGVNYSLYDRLSWSNVLSNIDKNMPFMMRTYALVSDKIEFHSLTGYGYSHAAVETSGTAGMRTINIWDPNGQRLTAVYNSGAYNLYGYAWRWYETISYVG